MDYKNKNILDPNNDIYLPGVQNRLFSCLDNQNASVGTITVLKGKYTLALQYHEVQSTP